MNSILEPISNHPAAAFAVSLWSLSVIALAASAVKESIAVIVTGTRPPAPDPVGDLLRREQAPNRCMCRCHKDAETDH